MLNKIGKIGDMVKFRKWTEVMCGVAIGSVGVYQLTCFFYEIPPTALCGALCAALGLGLVLVGITEHPKSEDDGKLNGQ